MKINVKTYVESTPDKVKKEFAGQLWLLALAVTTSLLFVGALAWLRTI